MRISRWRRSQSIVSASSSPIAGTAWPAAGTWMISSLVSPVTVAAMAIGRQPIARGQAADIAGLAAGGGIEDRPVEHDAATLIDRARLSLRGSAG